MGNLTHTVGGTDNLVNFKSAARVPIDSLKVHFSPIQEGEGDPSPENVRPISGWNNCQVYKTGENLLNLNRIVGEPDNTATTSSTKRHFNENHIIIGLASTNDYIPSRITNYTYLNGILSFISSVNQNYGIGFPIRLAPGTYYLYGEYENLRYIRILEYALDGSILYKSDLQNDNHQITIHDNTDMTVLVYLGYGESGLTTTIKHPYILKEQDDINDYSVYKGEKFSITFPVLGKNKFNYNEANIENNKRRDDTGVIVTDASGSYCQTLIPVIPNTIYTISGYTVNNVSKRIYYIDNNKNFISRTDAFGDNSYTFTTPSNCYYCQIQNREIANAGWETIQLELGSEATTYEPYKADNTVYGGYVDLAKGEVVATYFHYILNGTETGWSLDGSGDTSRRTYIDTARFNIIAKAKGKLFSNYCKTSGSNSLWWGWISSSGSSNSCHILFYVPATIDTKDKWRAYLAENPLEIVYELAEPIHYPLTPHQLTTFLNTNNFWSNTNGPTEVSYAIHDSESIRTARKRILAAAPKIKEASGSIATFNTDISAPLKECKAYFEPIQDLHGYDGPWIGGAGKNLFNPNCGMWNHSVYTKDGNNITQSGSDGRGWIDTNFVPIHLAAGTYTISCSDGNNFSYATSLDEYTTPTTLTNGGGSFTLLEDCDVKIKHSVKSGNSYPTTFTVQLEKGSTATSYESYENICPIEGWNNCKIIRCGENIFHTEWEQGTINGNTGELSNSDTRLRTKDYIKLKTGTRYVINVTTNKSNAILRTFYMYRNDTISNYSIIKAPFPAVTIPQSNNNNYIKLKMVINYSTDTTPISPMDIISTTIEAIPSGTSAYKPYQGQTISITFPSEAGTIYGGYVDLIKGEIISEYAYLHITGNENWYMSSGITGKCAYRPTLLNVKEDSAHYSKPISDKLQGIDRYGTSNYQCTINDMGNFYFGAPEELSTSEAVNAWIQEIGGIDVLIPLDTPIHYSLTPQQLKTLRGTNNIWSSANGDIEVKYWSH